MNNTGGSHRVSDSADGGTNWTTPISGTTVNLSSVYFKDVNTGWASGANGTVFKTTNGGTTWVVEPTGTTQAINDIGYGWAVGAGGIVLMNQALLTLPLQLLSISLNSGADCKSGLLQWTTAQEQGVSHFEIETSADGLNFKPVGQVNATNSAIAQHYSYLLNYSLLPLHVRLKMVDQDARFTYSKILTVKDVCGGAMAFSWSVSPNPMPANGSLQLSLTQYKGTGPMLVELFDMQGRPQTKVTLTPVTGSSNYTTEIAMPKALSSGVYTIRISNGNFSESRRIVQTK
ncbi:T9SS type A sorting domain-containing protein [Flavitalea sp.]|nr:T9SS type A sorting domain-containing protein [Flavitalea sp.]